MKRIVLSTFLIAACVTLGARPRYITYEKYGAKGDGVTDDMAAIAAAHEAANEMGLPVKVRNGRTYYIGGGKMTAIIKTDTDFGTAKFIIDDRELESVKSPVFEVRSYKSSINAKCRNVPKRGDSRIEMKLPCKCLVHLSDDSAKVYIRKGLNRNNGTAMSEVLIVNPDGSIDTDAGIVWDYIKEPKAVAYPIDEKTLTIKGGIFTTIANQANNTYRMYHDRGIKISRSNVHVEGIKHYVTGELDHGAPYTGFLNINKTSGVIVENCLFTAHMTYHTIGAAKKPVAMGSYDISITSSVNLTLRNCSQTTDIDDKTYWGLMGTNFCKNLLLENCTFSRFDAHQGVRNVTLRNCTFGHMGVRMVGWGTILMENCTSRYHTVIALRNDYGATWDGDIIIRNCTLITPPGTKRAYLLNGSNNGDHDFGYTCHLPSKIEVDGLVIDDSECVKANPDYKGPAVFNSFSYKGGDNVVSPIVAKGEVILRNVSVTSGKPLQDSENPELFKDYTFVRE